MTVSQLLDVLLDVPGNTLVILDTSDNREALSRTTYRGTYGGFMEEYVDLDESDVDSGAPVLMLTSEEA